MVMNDELKRAFRDAYNLLERSEVPVGTPEERAEKFNVIARDIQTTCGERGMSALVYHLMWGVYEYLNWKSKVGETS